MLSKFKAAWKKMFFPNDRFTLKMLEILNGVPNSTLNSTFAEIYHAFETDPSIGRVKLTLDRLEANGYIEVSKLLLSNPPKPTYRLTEKGRAHLRDSR
jgi:DNA-binding PadR family transcriptional regulator